mmetsp:Transcript_62518/g.101254  ORF Transcript_62518/g.101254 Transcript_62518/m.101254 type:complete len:218 (+) Transcript_62518:592-1245(+)
MHHHPPCHSEAQPWYVSPPRPERVLDLLLYHPAALRFAGLNVCLLEDKLGILLDEEHVVIFPAFQKVSKVVGCQRGADPCGWKGLPSFQRSDLVQEPGPGPTGTASSSCACLGVHVVNRNLCVEHQTVFLLATVHDGCYPGILFVRCDVLVSATRLPHPAVLRSLCDNRIPQLWKAGADALQCLAEEHEVLLRNEDHPQAQRLECGRAPNPIMQKVG